MDVDFIYFSLKYFNFQSKETKIKGVFRVWAKISSLSLGINWEGITQDNYEWFSSFICTSFEF